MAKYQNHGNFLSKQAEWARKNQCASNDTHWCSGEGEQNAQRSIFESIIAVNPVMLWVSTNEVKRITGEIGKISDWLPNI